MMHTIKELINKNKNSFTYIQNNQNKTQEFFNLYDETSNFLASFSSESIFIFLDGTYQSAAILLACLSSEVRTHGYSHDFPLKEIDREIDLFNPKLIFIPRNIDSTYLSTNFVKERKLDIDHFELFIDEKNANSQKLAPKYIQSLIMRTSGSTGFPKYLSISEDIINKR